MAPSFVVLASLCLLCSLTWSAVDAYGRVVEPVHRGGAWRKGFRTPRNFNDHANNCGGFTAQNYKNNAVCGPCGDDITDLQPRDNENGGVYGTGAIVRRYAVNQTIDIEIDMTANLRGHFELSICKLGYPEELETERCFDAHPLYNVNGKRRFYLPGSRGSVFVKLKVELPRNLSCERCVLRWHYRAGNNWGVCEYGPPRKGCGPQETFRTCSDISIL